MQVELNGKMTQLDGVATVGDLIRSKDLKPRMVAVELNGEIVPREKFDEQVLSDGDRLEIVHFVGGG
ncbi:MAG: sulfur carrier protein ThiS [Sphaerobacteraceae bacterium]|nr:MAG: sulfur carrier protein ThiS [Sphaerobacteraceae bacterium]